MVKFRQVEEIEKIMRNIEQVRNIGTLAHVDHGKTTTSDSLLMAAGMLSPKVAGKALALDYVEIEQLRQMTVKAANVSLYHEWRGKPYVVNLVDTPGHVDFTGHVTRSLRMMDGGLVVVDAVEGVMTQTETVVRQALNEYVKPLLFINKIDRLIKELRLNPKEIQQRFVEIVKDFNMLIELYADPEFKDSWKVDFRKGQVAFGSALHKWGLTIPIATEKGVKFDYIVDAYEKGYYEELSKDFPLHTALLDMIVEHTPNPKQAQKYRVPKLWKGDLNSEIGKAMLECDPSGPLVVAVSKVIADPHAGFVATGRVFSGTARQGDEVWLVNSKSSARILQVSLYMGPYREKVDEVTAGNIVAVLGPDKARAGETLVSSMYKDSMVPFERMSYISEPVVTIAIEPKHSSDLPKLIDALRKLAVEDPTLKVHINEETGEYLISGMGTLHLEIVLWDLNQRTGLEVTTSQPIVRYRETVRKKSNVFEGKSPNKHNRLYICVEPLNEDTLKLLQEGKVYADQEWRERARLLREYAGWDTDEARGIWDIDENFNIFVNRTSGIQYLREVADTIVQGFRWSMEAGPLAQEPVRGVKILLMDAQLHEDPAHRGPAQIMPATKNAIFASFLDAAPTLLEPLMKIEVRVPQEWLSGVLNVLNRHRGKVVSLEQRGMLMRILGEIPISETFNLADEMREATQGRAFWATEFERWSPIPQATLNDLIISIRKSKGLPPRIPTVEDFLSP
ncbi:MAG: elongation factor EF-2 [Thermofilaceae archaeon]